VPYLFLLVGPVAGFLLSMTRCFSAATLLALVVFWFWFFCLDFGDLSPMVEAFPVEGLTFNHSKVIRRRESMIIGEQRVTSGDLAALTLFLQRD
jgi:hypothetical protein